MWESLLKIGSGLLDFARGTKKNAEDIKKANQRIDEISNILLAAVIRMDNLEKMEAKDRQVLALKSGMFSWNTVSMLLNCAI